MKNSLKRIAAAALAASILVPVSASAGLFLMTDLWWNRSESGWGANVVEQEGVIFITFFVYGPDGKPTWYVGSNTVQDPSSLTWSGPLYVTTGPYFGGDFNPASTTVRQVGTVRLDASCSGCNTYSRAQLTYSVDGVTTTKYVERMSFKAMAIPTPALGSISARSGNTCGGIAGNQAASINYNSGSGQLSIVDTSGSNYVITLTGITQYGNQYIGSPGVTINGNVFSSTGFAFTVDYSAMYGTIRGTGSNGCTLRLQFSGMA